MPIYEYRCPNGHTHERLRRYVERDRECRCLECDELAQRILSTPHIGPDGMYSYAPNVGSKDAFDRKQAKIERLHSERKDGIRRRRAVGDDEI